MSEDKPNSPVAAAIAVVILICLVAGGVALYVLSWPSDAPSSPGAPLTSIAPPTPLYHFTGKIVAPEGDPMKTENGIVQRKDRAVFIHAGQGSVNVLPPSSNGPSQFGFGVRPTRNPNDPRPVAGPALNDPVVQKRIGFTDEQRAKLKRVGAYPQPTTEVKLEIRRLFGAYADADAAAKPAAEKALLEAVRQLGEQQAPLAAKWLADRDAILTDEQRTALRTPRRPATPASQPATVPAVERVTAPATTPAVAPVALPATAPTTVPVVERTITSTTQPASAPAVEPVITPATAPITAAALERTPAPTTRPTTAPAADPPAAPATQPATAPSHP